ncbi:MAG: ATP-binding protein [Bacteroidales bacterium]
MINVFCKSLFFKIIFLIVLLIPFSGFSKNQIQKNVLYVSSFSEKNSWAISCKEELLNKFKESSYSINLLEIYLDEKKNSKEEMIKILKRFISKNTFKIDVILAFDYGATDLFLTYTDSIISKIPIIFVSELEPERQIGFKNITGITSDYGVGQVYKTGLKMFPKTNKVYVWADKSPTGEFFMNLAKHILKGYIDQGVKIEFGVDANSKEELLKKCKQLDPHSFIIFGTWQLDDKGNSYIATELYPEIIKATTVPIFTVFDGFIGSGFVGGFVQIAKNNAGAAFSKAMRIFNGEIPEKMTTDNITPTPLYDYAEIIDRNGLFAVLPENTIVLNEFKAFFMAHKVLVILFIVVIIFVISIFILRLNNRSLNRKIKSKEKHEKELQLNIKLLSFAIPSLQILYWSYNENTKKFKIEFTGISEEKNLSEEINSEYILSNIAPEFRNDIIVFFNSLLNSDDGFEFAKEFRGKIPDLEEFSWWETRGIVELIEEKNEQYRIISGINFNIEKYKQNEIALNQALEKSIQSDTLKSKFIANISHEIRTPLNAILGFTDLVIDSENKEEQIEFRKIIRENNENLLNLVNDIIELSEIESGYIDLKRIKFDLKQYFEEIESLFKYKIKEGVELIVENPHKSCVVFLDKMRITQIIREVLDNSIKFTNKGHIKIGYEIVSENKIKFFIEDTGLGIKHENLPKIFDRFEKFDSFEHGTGLGLAIIKAILDKIGAQYGFESKESEGTKFWTIISSESIVVDDLNIKETNIEIDNYNPQKLKLLVVDKMACSQKLMETVLKEKYEISCLKTGEEAVDFALKNKPDIILVSLILDDIDGYEVIRRIRAFNKYIPIIAVSTKILSYNKQEAFEAGCDEFIEKPFDKDILFKIIERIYAQKKVM